MTLIQPKCIFLFYVFIYVINVCSFHPSPLSTAAPRRSYILHNVINYKIDLKFTNIVKLCVFGVGIMTSLWLSYLHLCNNVRYVCFTTNLNILTKENHITSKAFAIFWTFLLIALLFELEEDQILFFIIHTNPSIGSLAALLPNINKAVSRLIFNALSFYIFYISVTPIDCILSLSLYYKFGTFHCRKTYLIGCPCYSF